MLRAKAVCGRPRRPPAAAAAAPAPCLRWRCGAAPGPRRLRGLRPAARPLASSLARLLGLSAPGRARPSAALRPPAPLAAPPGCGRSAARSPVRSAGSLRAPLGCSVRPPLRSGRPARRCGRPPRSCAAARWAGPPVAPGRLRRPAMGCGAPPAGPFARRCAPLFAAPARRALGFVPPRRLRSRVKTSGCAALDSRRLRRQTATKCSAAGCARRRTTQNQ